MVIYFMRHTAVDVPQGVCYGQTDVPLKPTFEMEATQTAAHLRLPGCRTGRPPKGTKFRRLGNASVR